MNAQFLTDNQGNKSSSRLLMVAGTLIVLLSWAWTCFQTGSMVDVPPGVLGIVAVLIGGKQANSYLSERQQGDFSGKQS